MKDLRKDKVAYHAGRLAWILVHAGFENRRSVTPSIIPELGIVEMPHPRQRLFPGPERDRIMMASKLTSQVRLSNFT